MADYEDEYDESRYMPFVISLLLIAFVVVVALAGHYYLADSRARKACESNPRLLFAEQCSDHDDCVTKCIVRERGKA